MSVVGIDLGTLHSVVAVARNRGIDVVCNEVSNRSTPSLVSFGANQRYIGESAKTQEVANFKNTVGSLNRLLGRRFNEPEVRDVESRFVNAALCDVDGEVGVKVNYLGEETQFSATQVMAMLLGRLKDIASTELKGPVSDVVVSVPCWYSDRQRRAMLEASEIAGLNCLRVMNDITASALSYGITKTDLPEDKPRHVIIVDVGHAHYSVALVGYMKGELKVKGMACDRHFGGRNFDELLVDHYAAQIKEKYKIDVKSNSKALLRLRVGCEKLKKVLSANPQAPLHIESIMNDVDVDGIMKRAEFEELIGDILIRAEEPLKRVLEQAGLTVNDIDSVELVGGASRTPAIKERISKFFGKEISTTLNQDEAIARGCALQCAILSPAFKVRDFSVQDMSMYPIQFSWQPVGAEPVSECSVDVFSATNPVPCTKVLTFYRKEPFELEANYAESPLLPADFDRHIGRYTVQNVKPLTEADELATVKVKARISGNGTVAAESAYIAEEITKEEEVTDKAQSMDVDDKAAEGDAASEAQKKIRKIIKKHELPLVKQEAKRAAEQVVKLCEKEGEMRAHDKLVYDTLDRKNAVEEYVYEMRGKLDMQYSDYITDDDKSKFMAFLNSTEDWLYEDGENATKSVYVQRLADLKKMGDPVVERYREHQERPQVEAALQECINQFRTKATTDDERYDHIPEEEKEKVIAKCKEAYNWLDSRVQAQAALSKTDKPAVLAREIKKQQEDLVMFCSSIMSKPKPKVVEPEKPADAATEEPKKPQEEMDVD